MKGLKCENVVSLKSVLRSSRHIWLVMECLSGGCLLDLLMSYGRMDEQQSRWYFRQLVSAVSCCHAQGIYHRDLKPDNVLLTSDMLTVKITDFGLATLVEENQGESGRHFTRVGSTQYAAPELFDSDTKDYNLAAADVWGCGLLLYIMAAGFPPFSDPVPEQLIEKICAARVKFPSWFGEDLKDLLRKILKRDPKDRISIEEIRKHAWFRTSAANSKPLSSPTLRLNSPSSMPRGILNLFSSAPSTKSDSSLSTPSKAHSTSHLDYLEHSSSANPTLHHSAPQLHVHVLFGDSRPPSMDAQQGSAMKAHLTSPAPSPSSSSSTASSSVAVSPIRQSISSSSSSASSSSDSAVPVPTIVTTTHHNVEEDSLANSGIHTLSESTLDHSSILPLDVVPIANAFTLLNMSGAFDLSRLFHGPALKPFTLVHATKFVWQHTSVTQAFYSLVDILESLTLSIKKNEQSGRITVKAWSEQNGSCTFQVQIYTLLPDASLVEFSILGGSENAYYEFYRTIAQRTKALNATSTGQAEEEAFEEATLDDAQDKFG